MFTSQPALTNAIYFSQEEFSPFKGGESEALKRLRESLADEVNIIVNADTIIYFFACCTSVLMYEWLNNRCFSDHPFKSTIYLDVICTSKCCFKL